jgi:hypothetical protein
LNEQERLNAEHFGDFKILADNIGRKYSEYFKKQKIFTPNQILRMLEVNLVADLLIAMKEGIKPKKQIKRYYDSYEKNYDENIDEVENRFDAVIEAIDKLYPEGLNSTKFSRHFLFYSLFTSVIHCLYGLPNLEAPRIDFANDAAVQMARNQLDHVDELFSARDTGLLPKEEQTFLQDSRRATTDGPVRERRTRFLLTLMA